MVDAIELAKARVTDANQRLKDANVPVRLKLKGKNLAIVATCPKKPQHGTGRKQYDISLDIPATKTGVERAEREAHKLADRLANGSFQWIDYVKTAPVDEKTIGNGCQRLRRTT